MIGSIVNSIRNFEKWWLLLSALLIVAIIAGGIVFGLKQCSGSNPIEITLSSATAANLEVRLSGAVANEGLYTFSEDSSLKDILLRAGEITDEAETTSIEIHIPTANEDTSEVTSSQPQKININTAEAWLLEALPGIGPTLAQRIIEYRETEGPFQSVDELTNVNGIGTVTLENISNNICVFD